MLFALENFLEENLKNINKASKSKELKKIIDDIIDNNTWDESIKNVIQFLFDKKLQDKVIQYIISYWHSLGDLDVVFILLVKYYLLDKETLDKLFNILCLSDLKTLLMKTIEFDNNMNFHIVANTLISYFDNDLNCDDYLELIEYTKNFQQTMRVDCDPIIRFFTFKKSQLLFAPIPDWVSVKKGENLSLILNASPGRNFEDLDQEVDKIVDKAKNFFYFENKEADDKINKALLSFLHSSSLENSPEMDNIANRVFGPANRFVDRNCISNPGKEGPCRMLECLCLEIDHENTYDYLVEEWFTGKCDNFECSKKIRDRSHAIRYPDEKGGWKGCFCCFKCLNNSLVFRDEDTNFRIEYMKNALYEDGIMDRTKT